MTPSTPLYRSQGEPDTTVYTRRIMGVETEYGISATDEHGHHALPAAEVARYMFAPLVESYGSTNVFISNGSRLYLDMGAHPEIATAECDSITQLLNAERAGDRILDDMAQHAESVLQREGRADKVYLFKNNVDSHGNSYGCHENYLISRSMVLRAIGRALEPLMITRQLLCGAGMIEPAGDNHPGRFILSQRADHLWEGVSSATTRARPLINSRDEAHADSHRFRRLHVIGGDTNLSEPTFALKIGSALLVLEMIEAQVDLPDFELAEPIGALRAIARDSTGSTVLELKNGGSATALEILEKLAECAADWLTKREDYLDEMFEPQTARASQAEMTKVVDLWQRGVQAIASQDFSGVETELDWVTKKKLLDSYRQRLDGNWSHPKLSQIDLAMHDTRRGRGIYSLLEAKGLVARWSSDEAIAEAMNHPPRTTRAYLRGQFIDQARSKERGFSVDWSRMKLTDPEPVEYTFGDPFANSSADFDRLIEIIGQ